jgi:hypothetical protein
VNPQQIRAVSQDVAGQFDVTVYAACESREFVSPQSQLSGDSSVVINFLVPIAADPRVVAITDWRALLKR